MPSSLQPASLTTNVAAPNASGTRDSALRDAYAYAAMAAVPRLLGTIDRNPYRPTHGCLDREFWHYRTRDFACEMHQEGVLTLALAYAQPCPGNRWHGQPRIKDLAVAALEFVARQSRRDGSCDDYYPFERALGAAVFSLQAAAKAYGVLQLDSPSIRDWLTRRSVWVAEHQESGRLSNHQALAALGLLRVAEITGRDDLRQAAQERIRLVLSWQHAEGWFDEYGGADPGYQTITIDCLAKIRRMTDDASLDEPLRRAVAFARRFLYPDGSYGGEYGSRGTYHFYPHGMELLAPGNTQAAALAEGFLRGLSSGRQACFDDDRLFAHRPANLLEAWRDWSEDVQDAEAPSAAACWLPAAGLYVRRSGQSHTVISTSRGGIFKRYREGESPATDTGLVVETSQGRLAVSQSHLHGRQVEVHPGSAGLVDAAGPRITVTGPLFWTRFETATPLKQAIFHVGMWTVGRWFRKVVRQILQRRLITGRKPAPLTLRRTFEFLPGNESGAQERLRVTDYLELTDRKLLVNRLSFSSDLQAAYVAASNVWQDSLTQPWTDLTPLADELNTQRRLTIVREF